MEFTNDDLAQPSLRPLTLPEEIWSTLAKDARAVYERAQALVDLLEVRGPMTPAAASTELDCSLAELLSAVGLLEGMRVVRVEAGPVIHLHAIPDEHVGVVGPDGRRRWIFVCRPTLEPEVDSTLLN